MDQYQETFETWNKLASLYQDKFMDMKLYNDTYDDFIDAIVKKEKAKVLDIGCGPGNIIRYLLSKRADLEILGVDISPNMIELAKANNPQANFEIADCRDISKIPDQFDAIICGFCLPYLSVDESAELIYSCDKLLREKGVVYLSFVEGSSKDSGFKTDNSGNRVYFYYHDLDMLKETLSNAGFDHIEVWHLEYGNSNTKKDVHTVIIARKK